MTPTTRTTLALSALCLALLACGSETDSPDERGKLGKADLFGSCAPKSGGDFCGGQSEGGCWCDDQCEAFGDCCEDIDSVCSGVTECPQTCGEFCPMAQDCSVPPGCSNPGCGCPEKVCDNECAAAGGTCTNQIFSDCELIEPGTEETGLSCGDEGTLGPVQKCCAPKQTECEAAGGECFGGTFNCETSIPGTTNGGSCGTGGDGPQPQLTCCVPD